MKTARKRIGVVVTTISDGQFLSAFADAIDRHGGRDDIGLYVVGDLNTPAACQDAARRMAADGYDCRYLDAAAQDAFLAPFPVLQQGIPYRSDNRRNVGYLMALRDGSDVVISVDDDNLPRADSDFFGQHARTGDYRQLPTLAGARRWANICSLLDMRGREDEPVRVYPRGYPYSARGDDRTRRDEATSAGISGINVGLWTGDPDIDAPTRLVTACRAELATPHACFLGDGQRTPITSQNTSIVREAVPAYYFWRMGQGVGGMKLDRYGDMFSGYCAALCAEAVGHRVSVGTPYVNQARNEHNLYKDVWNELAGMVLIDDMRELIETPLSPASRYDEAYLELIERFLEWSSTHRGYLWDTQFSGVMRDSAALMRAWVDACRALAPADALRARRHDGETAC
ncbi:MAG: hypothetical protein JSR59_22980 [Proteobacteria bacterium]|nr:hypothetical protein [Pseudomonadota bacterium]